MMQPRYFQSEPNEKYIDVMKSIAFDDSVNSSLVDSFDPLYQIALQMKIENCIDAISYLKAGSQTLGEQEQYREQLENIIDSCSKENIKGKLI